MNKKKDQLLKFVKSKKGKQILFFSFYFFFFLFLFLYIDKQDYKENQNQISNDNINQNNKQENNYYDDNRYYETNNLENSDYTYKITIQTNDQLQVFEGSKNNKDALKNYEYYEFVDLNEIKRIIKNAKYISKSLSSINTYKVNYEIKTNILHELLDSDNNNDSINSIELTVLDNNDLIKIELDFSNYLTSIDYNIFRYKVLIEYEY